VFLCAKPAMLLSMIQFLKVLLGLSLVNFAASGSWASAQDSVPPDLGLRDLTGQRPDFTGLKVYEPGKEQAEFLSYLGDGKPVLLGLIYFNCPGICTVTLNRTLLALREAGEVPGDSFRLAFLTFVGSETPELAEAKKAAYVKRYPEAKDLRFLLGGGSSGSEIARRLGFNYRWNAEAQMYEHGTVLYWIDKNGEVRRQLLGKNLNSRDLKIALREMNGQSLGPWEFDRRTSGYRLKPAWLAGAVALLAGILAGMGTFGVRRLRKRRLSGGAVS